MRLCPSVSSDRNTSPATRSEALSPRANSSNQPNPPSPQNTSNTVSETLDWTMPKRALTRRYSRAWSSFAISITPASSSGTLAGKLRRFSSVAASSSFHSANTPSTMITVMKFHSLIRARFQVFRFQVSRFSFLDDVMVNSLG